MNKFGYYFGSVCLFIIICVGFERAKGAAKAIEIENGAITPTYIQYLWVRQQNLSGNNSKIIYIPTEAGLPLLEAGRSK